MAFSISIQLESLEELNKISTSQERQSFIQKLDEVEEWLYSDGEDASANDFQERLDLLKAVDDPIFFRFTELTARPEACEDARRYLGELQQIVRGWEANKPWLPKERIDKVLKDAENVKSWLAEKEAKQKKTEAYIKPAFTSDEVYEKVSDLQYKVSNFNKIPKPKPKVDKPVKNETESPSSSEGKEDSKFEGSEKDSIGENTSSPNADENSSNDKDDDEL